MTERFEAIVVGAGHNGLVCAALLARAGKDVLVLEANDQVGGAAVTREFADGHAVSACAHLLYQLSPAVRKELRLKPKLAAEDMATIALREDGEHLRIRGGDVEGASDADANIYAGFHKRMTRYAGLLGAQLNRPPPRLGAKGLKNLLPLAKLGFDVRRLGTSDMREFLRLIGMNIHDEVTERFESPALRGAVSVDAVLGTHLGPRSPNTVLTYLYRLAGNHGRMAQPAGGMGSVVDELAEVATNAGAIVRTGTPVKRIVVMNGRVTGVELESGESIESYMVISNADPKSTLMCLVGARHLEAGFARRVHHYRSKGNAAKLHLALDGLPDIAGLSRSEYGDRILIAPDEHYVERAFNPAKYGESSPEPVVEMTFPSFRDPRLAPSGKHVLSAVVQYAPYAIKGGWTDGARAGFEAATLRVIERFAPDVVKRITASELLTPADIEREFLITGGHWHHGELTMDQFMFTRPVIGAANYRTPLEGLWLCGAGTHPGGGVSGAAGRNAAKVILKREKSR